MLWFKRRPEGATGGAYETVEPVVLAVELDARVFTLKLASLLEALSEVGGIEPFLAALSLKSDLFEGAVGPTAIGTLDLAKLEVLLETVMPARKRIWPSLTAMGDAGVRSAVTALLYGSAPLEDRMNAFVAAVPVVAPDAKGAKKVRRALWDFGAELLHFRKPLQYPLMTRWVWDQASHAGAIRELVKGGDTLTSVPLGTDPGVFEAARQWLAERLADNGVYRDPHFVVDIFLAHAYADYMRALSSGMGLLNADFGGKSDPLEVVRKLLGIDAARRTESRVKKVLQ